MDHENFNRREGWNWEDYDIVDRIQNGDFAKVEFLIDKHGFIRPHSSFFLLCTALKSNQKDIARLLLSKGAEVNSHRKFKSKLGDGIYTPYTPLHWAVRVCDKEIMESLLQRGALVNAKAGPRNSTPLFECVLFKKADMMEILLRYEADLNIPAGNGETPLQCAAGGGYTDATKMLLDHGADPNAALHYAAKRGKLNVVKLLLSYGANINPKWHYNPLHAATENRHAQLVEYLLQRGADVDGPSLYSPRTVLCVAVDTGDPVIVNIVLSHRPDLKNKDNQNAVGIAVSIQKKDEQGHAYGEIIENLVSYGFNISDKDADNPKLLFIAIKNGYVNTIQEVLSRGSNLKVLRNSILRELVPLYPSTLSNKSKIATILVKYGVDDNVRYSMGLRPQKCSGFRNMDLGMFELLLTDRRSVKNPILMKFAVCLGHLEIVQCLLQLGSDVNAQDTSGLTALHFCVLRPMNLLCPALRRIRSETKADINIVRFLLSQNANVNAANELGETPLHLAAENNLIEILKFLVSAKADINAADLQGTTALHHLARNANCIVEIKNLLSEGADVNAKREDGFTPLHIASKEGQCSILQLLLEYGANINCQSKTGTPLHVACLHERSHVVKYLVEYGADVNATVDGVTPMVHATMIQVNPAFPDLQSALQPFQQPNSPRTRTLGFLLRHLAKMKAANLFLNEENLKYTGQHFYNDFQRQDIWTGLRNSAEYEPSRHETECEEEVALMVCDRIGDSNFSFYDVLVGSEERVMKLSANENLVQVVFSASFEARFPNYASLIQGRILKGRWLRKLREKCMSQIRSAIGPRRLPSLCIERIIDNLTVVDLRKLADSPQCPP